MHVPPAFLEDIRRRITASSVVGRYVSWDRRKSNPGRGDFWACCPFHAEKTASFHVEDRKGRYYCFGCRAAGDIFRFLVEKDGLSFAEAVERLARQAGLALPAVSPEAEAREQARVSLYEVMERAAVFFEAQLQAAKGAEARGYLADRGLATGLAREFRLGYAPNERSALRGALAGQGITLAQMIEAGLIVAGEDIPVAYDRFRDRVMFPIRDAQGRVIAFGGRALSKDVQAKYLNSPETPLFHKGSVLYNLDKARGAAYELSQIIAVEGYMDAIAMHRAGLPQTVAPLGTALTPDQLDLLWRLAPEPTLCFDGDAAGLKAAYRALDLALPLLKPGHSLKFVLLPDGQDPDDLLRREGPEALKAAVAAAQPLSDVLWNRALALNDRSTPERRAQLERELDDAISLIGDGKVRSHYAAELGARLRALWGNRPARRPFRGIRALAPGRRKPWPKPWELATAASPRLKALSRSGAERRERLIVLTLVNHPELIHEFLDEFATAEIGARELDGLRRDIIDIAAVQEGLDRVSLRDHLTSRGYGTLLARLDDQAARLSEWVSGSDAASADARTGLSQMVALHRKSVALERELKSAEAAFAAEPTEENLNALKGINEQLRSDAGAEASIEGFGQASGRPQSAIS